MKKRYHIEYCSESIELKEKDLVNIHNDIMMLSYDVGMSGYNKVTNSYDKILEFIDEKHTDLRRIIEKDKFYFGEEAEKTSKITVNFCPSEFYLIYCILKDQDIFYDDELTRTFKKIVESRGLYTYKSLVNRCSR